MNRFASCLNEQLTLHSSMESRDVVKLCYQAACGAEHLLSDLAGAKAYFEEEFQGVMPKDEPLYESISEHVCRVNMAAWKQKGLSKEWLFRMFTGTVFTVNGKQRLADYLEAAEVVLRTRGFDMDSWYGFIEQYKADGMPAVRHSETYRVAEQPAYRIVNAAYLPLLPVLERASAAEKQPFVIAIDGKAGAGKSTYAKRLQEILDGDMVYLDDFFLPPELRTPERLNEAGGNIHYERFAEQVLPYIREAEGFSYEVFDCSRMAICGSRELGSKPYRIAEGSYSHHPKFGDYADLRLFVDVDPVEQMKRIELRNGEVMAERFRTQWIPMENRYFDTFHIPKQADIIIE